ncbi:hypothetical protein E4T43_05932 [Aureobasidium subglaciale]|nr:hypothetical protein E4T43_05932 [Aureobasidium subglaciale]
MPARQHPAPSEVVSSSSPTSPHHRSSLRRLSSLANLQQFNPFNSFNRRRSSHGTQNSDEDPLASATKSILKVGNRRGLVRSDTEPLLIPHRTPNASGSARVLKENVSLSTNKGETESIPLQLPNVPLALIDLNPRRPESPLKFLRWPQTPANQPSKSQPRKDSLQPSTPQTPVTLKASINYAQSPTTLTTRPRRQTMLPPDVVPLLSPTDNKQQRSSLGSSIQPHQLLTSRNAPVTPLISRPRPSVSYLPSGDLASSVNIASDYVTSAQSTAYWSGRLMSQFDRHRNEKLQASMTCGELSSTYPENDLNLCLGELQKKCVTEAAKLSFAMFKARVYVKAGTLGTTRGAVESGIEGKGKDMVEA